MAKRKGKSTTEYMFFSETEYRTFLRRIPNSVRFETKSKPFEIPIILVVDEAKNAYICRAGE